MEFYLILLPKIASVHFSLLFQLELCCTSSSNYFDHNFACKKQQFTICLALSLVKSVSLFEHEYLLID